MTQYNVKYKESTQHKSMRLPQSIIDDINEIAKGEKQSFTFVAVWLLKQGLIKYNGPD